MAKIAIPLTASLFRVKQSCVGFRHLRWFQRTEDRGLKTATSSFAHLLSAAIKSFRIPTVFDALAVLASKQQAQSSFFEQLKLLNNAYAILA